LLLLFLKADVRAESYAPIFDEIKTSGADGPLVDELNENLRYRAIITGLAAEYRLPAMYPYREFIVDGGLLAYATDFSEITRIAPARSQAFLAVTSRYSFRSTDQVPTHRQC
jgi:hypothetical protein